jgi:DNA repair exonuclease SbcCD ATPase subunit
MNFRSIELENFQSYEHAKFEFTDYKITFITGINQDTGSSNGAGKSGIKEALFYTVFGRSKVKGPDLIRRGQKAMKAHAVLEHNGHTLDITRTRKAQTSTLELSIDGAPQVGTLVELQAKIEQALDTNLESFVTYSIIDKVRDTDLSKLSSTDLRLVLQDLLGLDKIQKAMTYLHQQATDIDKYLGKVHLKFYPSLKRKQLLADAKSKLMKRQQDYGMQLLELTSKKSQMNHDIFALDETIKELLTSRGSVLSTSTCPTCGAAIDINKKMSSLNKYEEQLMQANEKKVGLNSKFPEINESIEAITTYHKLVTDRLYKCLTRITQLDESMKDQADIEEYIKDQQRFVTASKVLQDYVSSVLSDIAVRIEDQMNMELARFSDLFCKINLSKTTNAGLIVPTCSISIFRDQYEYTYDMLSSGEQALISLLFKVVISNLHGNVSVLFIDEGLDALDEVNRERILSLLEVSPYAQIFLISHREDAAHIKAGQRILLRKEHGITQVINI